MHGIFGWFEFLEHFFLQNRNPDLHTVCCVVLRKICLAKLDLICVYFFYLLNELHICVLAIATLSTTELQLVITQCYICICSL